MMARLRFLEEAQYWPCEKIHSKQSHALRALIRTSFDEVPFYHQRWAEKDINPADINALIDLGKLPILTKDDFLRAEPASLIRPTGQKTYLARTSGSTGKNFAVVEDAYTAGWYRAAFLLSLEWAGWKLGEQHLQTGMTLARSLDRRIKDWLLGCYYFSAFELDDDHLDKILDQMDVHNLKHLWGYPGSLYFLAKRACETGWNRALKSVVSWGDSLYTHYRDEVESVFHTRVYDTYGCAEGFQIAAQCESGNYHLHALDTIVEFLDDQGQPVGPGEVGNIVATRLHPGPMPLVRYAVGDLGVPSSLEACSCGRGLPLMDSIKGRDADVILTPSGNRLIVHFFTGIMEHFPQVDSFQIVQTDSQSILIRIQPSSEITDKVINQIKTRLAEMGAADLRIDFIIVDQIPMPPSGKHRFVINQMKSENHDPS
jgi:phenylacetate-CoA ligase